MRSSPQQDLGKAGSKNPGSGIFFDLGDGIYCIDALYTARDIACCYLLVAGNECALIETGTTYSVGNIEATLRSLGIDRPALRYIIPTHIHLDHAGGAGQLMQRFPNATLLVHPRGARHMLDPTRLVASSKQVYGEELFSSLYGEILPIGEARLQTLADGVSFSVGDRELRVRHTRGHADHHFCLYDAHSDGWFTGDMFGVSYARQRFADGDFVMPATTPTQFDPALYAESIQRLAAGKPRRFYLTHFGALPFHEAQCMMMLRQLERYAELGRDYTGDIARLEEDVLRVTREELCHFLDPRTADEEVRALHMDAKLNAQGIAWWSASQASRA
ncbi:MAG: MBL fold metallo-hydrolase [Congregibacter sp.]